MRGRRRACAKKPFVNYRPRVALRTLNVPGDPVSTGEYLLGAIASSGAAAEYSLAPCRNSLRAAVRVAGAG